VAGSGFGNATVTTADGGGGRRSAVQQGSFGDAEVATAPQARAAQRETPPTPVEITFKPRPEYTDQARQKRIEGEVLVRVMFSATGKVQVLNIVRGLGFGLDENALRAAQQIQFKPAQRDGNPVDSTATVHIVFQLAY
jgi:TonB family protein